MRNSMNMTMTVYFTESSYIPEPYQDVPFIPRVGEGIMTRGGMLRVTQVIYNYEDRHVSVYV